MQQECPDAALAHKLRGARQTAEIGRVGCEFGLVHDTSLYCRGEVGFEAFTMDDCDLAALHVDKSLRLQPGEIA